MKSKKNAFLLGSIALVVTCTAQAAQIDVCGVVTGLGASAQAPLNSTANSGVNGVHAITTNTTWTKNNEYFLTDRVFVAKNVTLTIEAGTKIYGSTNPGPNPSLRFDDNVGSLVAARGGRIVADGTAAEPIVFSAVAKWEMLQTIPADSIFDPDTNIGVGTPSVGVLPGNGNAGLWGGVVLLGNAYTLNLNAATGNNLGREGIEGFVPSSTPDDNTSGYSDASEFGFDASGEFARDDNDDSGIYRYITIEHGGYEFESGREINGLTLGGVGAGTVIENIEVIANQDDGIEFFGGTVSASNLLLAYNQDDSLDMDQGFTGTIQFFLSFQNPGFADGGFEHDGVESTTRLAADYDAGFTTVDTIFGAHVPKAGNVPSKPKLYNGTILGPGRSGSNSTIALNLGQVLTEKGNHGAIYDDYYDGDLYNSVIDDFSQDLAFFRDGAKSYGSTATVGHNTLGRFGSALNFQIDTATAAGTIGTAGDINVTVTGALVTGSPLLVTVPAASGDTAAVWAGKVRTALNALPAITTHYVVGGSSTAISLRVKVAAANDGLNIAIANGTTTGVTAVVNSANTVAGGSSVTPGQPLTYISGTNVRGLFMDIAGLPTNGNSAVNTDPMLTTYTRDGNNVLTALDPRPATGSPLLNASIQTGAPELVSYRGAFAPGANSNWAAGWSKLSASGILLGTAPLPVPPSITDTDGDGISDALEATTALTSLGFSAAVNNVTPTNLFNSIYTPTSILDLRTVGQTMVQAGASTVTLTLPLQKSTGLDTWATVTEGPFTLTIPKTSGKEFYRLRVDGAE